MSLNLTVSGRTINSILGRSQVNNSDSFFLHATYIAWPTCFLIKWVDDNFNYGEERVSSLRLLPRIFPSTGRGLLPTTCYHAFSFLLAWSDDGPHSPYLVMGPEQSESDAMDKPAIILASTPERALAKRLFENGGDLFVFLDQRHYDCILQKSTTHHGDPRGLVLIMASQCYYGLALFHWIRDNYAIPLSCIKNTEAILTYPAHASEHSESLSELDLIQMSR